MNVNDNARKQSNDSTASNKESRQLRVRLRCEQFTPPSTDIAATIVNSAQYISHPDEEKVKTKSRKHISTSATKKQQSLQEYSERKSIICFVCGDFIRGNVEELNEHVNYCLTRQNEPYHHPSKTSPNGDKDHSTEDSSFDRYEEYEWNGVTRVRPSSMTEFSKKDLVKDLNVPDDLNIADEEGNMYGNSQYSESSLIFAKTNDSFYEETTSINHTSQHKEDKNHSDESNCTPQFSSPISSRASFLECYKGTDPQLLIESLKLKVKSQERLLINSCKCLLCMEKYENPLTSIVCWHVHCELCWMQALGAKKVCPQCSVITKPSDLRRIYL